MCVRQRCLCFALHPEKGLQWRSGPGDTGRWWTDRDAPCSLLCCPRLRILSFWNCYINKHTIHNLGGLAFFFSTEHNFLDIESSYFDVLVVCSFLLVSSILWWVPLVAQWSRICLPVLGMWVQSLVWEDPLEKRMATNSSILAWKVSWTEEPGRLQSMGSQKSQTLSNLATKQQYSVV